MRPSSAPLLRTATAGAVLLMAACGPARDAADDLQTLTAELRTEAEQLASELASPDGTDTGQTPADPGTTPADGGATATTSPTGGDGAQTALTPVDEIGGVGVNAPAYLRDDRPAMVVEIDVQEGVAVDQQAVDHLLATLDAVADKPQGISLAGGNRFASDRTTWGTGDLRAVAGANRSTYTTDTTTAIYILYVRGSFSSDHGEGSALGVAYNASEAALFPERWAGLGSLLGSDRAIERAVLVHELGHLLGLVNLTYTSEIDHEDPEHRGHSGNRESVMYWAIETDLIGQVFAGPPPDRFDDADLADLEGLRTGRYP